ncbi:MAG: YtxH domain-containing protein [Actinomycetota bacterium]
MGKVLFVLGGAIGFVIGMRVGRQGYDRLKQQASGLWNDPRVQKAASEARDFAEEKFPKTTETVTKVATAVTETAQAVADSAKATA